MNNDILTCPETLDMIARNTDPVTSHMKMERLNTRYGQSVAWQVIEDIAQNGPSTYNEVCARINGWPPTVSTVISKLVKQGILLNTDMIRDGSLVRELA